MRFANQFVRRRRVEQRGRSCCQVLIPALSINLGASPVRAARAAPRPQSLLVPTRHGDSPGPRGRPGLRRHLPPTNAASFSALKYTNFSLQPNLVFCPRVFTANALGFLELDLQENRSAVRVVAWPMTHRSLLASRDVMCTCCRVFSLRIWPGDGDGVGHNCASPCGAGAGRAARAAHRSRAAPSAQGPWSQTAILSAHKKRVANFVELGPFTSKLCGLNSTNHGGYKDLADSAVGRGKHVLIGVCCSPYST